MTMSKNGFTSQRDHLLKLAKDVVSVGESFMMRSLKVFIIIGILVLWELPDFCFSVF